MAKITPLEMKERIVKMFHAEGYSLQEANAVTVALAISPVQVIHKAPEVMLVISNVNTGAPLLMGGSVDPTDEIIQRVGQGLVDFKMEKVTTVRNGVNLHTGECDDTELTEPNPEEPAKFDA